MFDDPLPFSVPANKAKLLLGIPRDPDLSQYLAQMEEENENNEDEKPKVQLAGCVDGSGFRWEWFNI